MSELQIFELEPERYELSAAPLYHFSLDRRGFLKTLGGGILIVSLLESKAAAQRRGAPAPKDIGSWLHVSDSGRVTAFTGKAEVGQNTRTALTQAVAEELGKPVELVELVMGDTDRVPYDMGTFGSMSTPQMAPQLRRAAAAAKRILDSGGKLDSGAIIADATPKIPLGQSIPKVSGRAFVTGGHRYTSDLRLPEMLYGKVIRPDQYSATIGSFDASAAEKLTGVKVIRDGEFAGVVAPSTSAASVAASAVKVGWKPGPPQTSTSASIFSNLKVGASVAPQKDIEDALAASAHKLERTYTVAYIAHVPLEPRAAVAQWNSPDKLTVWTGTQVPFGVREELAEAFGLKNDQVRVIVPDTGSGYGGKHTGECAIEAARLAKAAGKPVKLVWTREEEFMWAYFRPAGVIDVRAGVDSNGKLMAWDFHNYNSGGSALQTKYDIPAKRTEFHQTKAPLRQGSYRGLAATANHFAREVHIDELAQISGIDPLLFRIQNTSDPRLKTVLQAAADKFGWNKVKGQGIACGFEKNGYVACCAEVRDGKVVRLVGVFECGAIVNPAHLRMQVEGAMVMGLGGALFESVEFANGKLLNGRLSKYRVPRFRDVPQIEVVIIDRKDIPSAGAGETPIVGVAPTIANAFAAATGERRRALPLFNSRNPVETGTN